MKRLHFNKKQLCRAIRAAVIAFIFSLGLRPAVADPVYGPGFSVNGSNVTGSGTYSTYFYDGTSQGYTVKINPGAQLTSNSGYVIQINHGAITNSGSLYSSNDYGVYLYNNTTATTPTLTSTVTNTASGYIFGSTYGVYLKSEQNGGNTLSNAMTVTNSGTISANYNNTDSNAVYIYNSNNNTTGDLTNVLTLNNLAGGNLSSTDSRSSYSAYNGAILENYAGLVAGNVTNTINIANSGSISGYSGYGVYAANYSYYTDNGNANHNADQIHNTINLTNSNSLYGYVIGAHLYNQSYEDEYSPVIQNSISIQNTASLTAESNSHGTNSYALEAENDIYYGGYYGNASATLTNSINLNNTGQIVTYSGNYSVGAYLYNYNYVAGSYYNYITGQYISGTGTSQNSINVANSGTISGYNYGLYAYNSIEYNYGGTTLNSITLNNSGSGQIMATGTASSFYGAYLSNFSSNNYYNYNHQSSITVNNAGTISGPVGLYATNTGYSNNEENFGTSQTIANNITLNNTGTITGSVSGNYGAYLSNSETNSYGQITNTINVVNSGLIQSGAIGLNLSNSGYSYNNLVINSATVYNTGQITGVSYGVVSNSDHTSITSAGGGIRGLNVSVVLGGDYSTLTIQGRSHIQGLMNGGTYSHNYFNANLVGVTPTQAAALKALSGSGSGTYTIGNYVYHWAYFAGSTINAVSLEQVADPGLMDLATKIDNNPGLSDYSGPGSAGAAFDKFYTAAASNPEAALQQLSGRTITQGTQDVVVNGNQSLLSQWGSQLENNFGAAGGFDAGNFSMSTRSLMAFNDTSSQLDHLVKLASTDAGPMLIPETNNNRWGAWLSGNITVADSKGGTNNQPGYNAVNGSPTLGFDYQVSPEWKIGALASASVNGANFNDGSRIDTTTELLGAYASYARGPWRAHAIAAGGIAQYDNKRMVFGDTAEGKPNGYNAMTEATVGYEVSLGNGYRITPEVGLQYTHVNEQGYTENGAGALDLTVASQDIDSLRTHLGAKLDKVFDISHDLKFSPELRAAWYHECLDDARSVSSSLTGAPAIGSFVTQTSDPQRDYALLGVGLNTEFTGYGAPVGLFINYDVQAGQSDYIEHNITGGIRVAF